MVVFTIIKGILGLVSVIVGLWIFIGVPLGAVLFVIYLLTKDKVQKVKLLKWIKMCFLSLLVMVGLLVLWAGASFVAALLGISLVNTLPIK